MSKFFSFYKTGQIIYTILCILFLSSMNELCGMEQIDIPKNYVIKSYSAAAAATAAADVTSAELKTPSLNTTYDCTTALLDAITDHENETEILKILNETLNDLETDNITAAAAANTDTNVRFYVQHCEKADDPILTYLHPFNARNIYQQIFALRFWASIFLCIHLVMIIYHSLLNCLHRVPTSQRFNRAFAIIGLIIWNVISLWITYQYYAWDRTFVHALAPIIPRIPAEFVAVLMLATTMNLSLLYELFTPITYSISYDLGPRYHHSRQGYVPAAQSENKYINGIIRQLEAPQHQPPERSSKNRPIGNHTI